MFSLTYKLLYFILLIPTFSIAGISLLYFENQI